ncbi:hypothetical protein IE81DRAFT_48031 [Ceraceosorus guamensis]|uniref:Uncharacterized protein n=1 Tax=Ceraceosorus guamensis TaxID=1522189 RepID=A0A316W7T1_9BASI|nr:hypothetical protein IE81DRAFT_48031 [Ceraceosorus guamensis]PWN44113.1 hypothetical protein IE81DRAFT_48031 [Ceraceosorus guamensis]
MVTHHSEVQRIRGLSSSAEPDIQVLVSRLRWSTYGSNFKVGSMFVALSLLPPKGTEAECALRRIAPMHFRSSNRDVATRGAQRAPQCDPRSQNKRVCGALTCPEVGRDRRRAVRIISCGLPSLEHSVPQNMSAPRFSLDTAQRETRSSL